MTDAWEERRKALENEYFHKIEARLIEQMRRESREQLVRDSARVPRFIKQARANVQALENTVKRARAYDAALTVVAPL